jgi:hypothetical protein
VERVGLQRDAGRVHLPHVDALGGCACAGV